MNATPDKALHRNCFQCGCVAQTMHVVHDNAEGPLTHREVCEACYSVLSSQNAAGTLGRRVREPDA